MDWPEIASPMPAALIIPAQIIGTSLPSALAWSTANTAIYIPFSVPRLCTLTDITFQKGAVAGNVNVAIYDDSATGGLPGARIGSALGSTAVAATANIPQVLNITDQVLGIGRYYIGIVFDDTATLTLSCFNVGSAVGTMYGTYTEASAFTLPATATPADQTAAVSIHIPILRLRFA